jgi:uracil-DNA glycosylase
MMDHLFDLLLAHQGPGVFNQYRDRDPALDRPDAPIIRRTNLRRYLETFAGAAYVLVGEAAGYAGCRFSGIPFTGEAQLVGAEPLPWAIAGALAQSSLGAPWRERSAQIVWPALDGRLDCVLWNAFPWHPFRDGPLSNRRPRRSELRQASAVLDRFLALFPQAQVCAIGRVSHGALQALGVEARFIRHPSHGGKRAFTAGVNALPQRERGRI